MKIPRDMSDHLFLSYGCAGSDYRELLLKRAKDEFAKGNISGSIFYQIKSLCTEFESRFTGQNEESDCFALDPDMKQTKLIKESLVLKYALAYLKKRKKRLSNSSENTSPLDSIKDYSEGMQRIGEICSSLPEEWTVIQLCKEQKNSTTFSMFREIIAADAPIYLSILKHPRSEEFPEAICLRLTSSNQVQLFEKFSILTSSYTELSTFPSGAATSQDRENYWAGMAVLESRVTEAVSELKAFMGPWVTLLCGNVKNGDKTHQEALFKAVDELCDYNQFNWRQRVLLSLLAQQRNLLSDKNIKQASVALVDIHSNSTEDAEESAASRVIYDFLTQIPLDRKLSFSPCILILDERIDHFYWEVLNPFQELCRMSSFHILVRLFERYKSRIKNGYLMVDVQQGRSVINPDCNLPSMEERMKNFFNYWLPNWKCTYNVVPKAEDFMKIFDEADCYVYCGHGSGLQYINGRKISKFQMKCVVFLFGCDSVRLRSKGLHSEMIGSHLFYHAALCPAVVGTLQLGFDFQVDKIATTLLSEWVPSISEDVLHWHHIDKAIWKKGSIKPLHTKHAKISVGNYEGSLARAVSAIHQKTEEKLYNTVGFVYRGLPAWNSSNTYL